MNIIYLLYVNKKNNKFHICKYINTLVLLLINMLDPL